METDNDLDSFEAILPEPFRRERDVLIQERNRLKAALEDIQAMTRPVERTVTTSRYPLMFRIHDIAVKALKGE